MPSHTRNEILRALFSQLGQGPGGPPTAQQQGLGQQQPPFNPQPPTPPIPNTQQEQGGQGGGTGLLAILAKILQNPGVLNSIGQVGSAFAGRDQLADFQGVTNQNQVLGQREQELELQRKAAQREVDRVTLQQDQFKETQDQNQFIRGRAVKEDNRTLLSDFFASSEARDTTFEAFKSDNPNFTGNKLAFNSARNRSILEASVIGAELDAKKLALLEQITKLRGDDLSGLELDTEFGPGFTALAEATVKRFREDDTMTRKVQNASIQQSLRVAVGEGTDIFQGSIDDSGTVTFPRTPTFSGGDSAAAIAAAQRGEITPKDYATMRRQVESQTYSAARQGGEDDATAQLMAVTRADDFIRRLKGDPVPEVPPATVEELTVIAQGLARENPFTVIKEIDAMFDAGEISIDQRKALKVMVEKLKQVRENVEGAGRQSIQSTPGGVGL